MALTDTSLLQISYESPQLLGDGTLFYVKKQQIDIEGFAQDAWNWSLESHIKSGRIVGGWVPVKTAITFTNTSDPDKYTAHYVVTYAPVLPPTLPRIHLEAIYAASIALGMVPGLFFRELFNASVAVLWVGIQNWAEDTWTFSYTPGNGDGQAASLWSYERIIQQYITRMEEEGYI